MFRKKKNVGSVTVLEEDDLTEDRRRDLLPHPPEPVPSDNDMNGMTAAQLQQVVQSTAQSGKDATTRALRMAVEAREVGVNTAVTMQQQTAQLEKMSEEIEVVHDNLDKSERLIDKMTKPKLARMFQRKKVGGKGLDKVKGSKKEMKERSAIREKGLETLDVGAMQAQQDGSAVMLDELQRDELFAGETVSKRGWRGRKDKDEGGPVDPRKVREQYEDYDPAVATVLRDQDDDLDQISDAVADMKALATAMNNELDYQDKLITEVKDFSSETSKRTKENAKKINRIK